MNDIPGLIERLRIIDDNNQVRLAGEAAAALTELQARLTSSQLQCRDAVERYEMARATIATTKKDSQELKSYLKFLERDRDWWKDEAERFSATVLAVDEELKRRGLLLNVKTDAALAGAKP